MQNLIRQISFLSIGIILRWPLYALIGIIGRTGIFKTVFLLYPTDEIETLKFCPNIPLFRKYLSGNPTPAGLIMNGWLPMGIYLVIPDGTDDLMSKKNRHIVEKVIRHMRWFRRLTGARTIGLAGLLGPIFSRRHNIPIEPPFFSSTYGNIFSIHEAINWVARQKTSFLRRQKVTIIGGGDLGTTLEEYLNNQGYDCSTKSIRFSRKRKVIPIHLDQDNNELHGVDFVINLLQRGEDFMDSGLAEYIPANAAIIDFSHPAIPAERLEPKVYPGNRVRQSNIRFMLAMPGGWKQKQLPACSLQSIISAMTGNITTQLDAFCLQARQQSFSTALVDTQITNQTKKQSFWDTSEGNFVFKIGNESVQDSM